jgi:sulfur-carrier protein
LTKKAIAMTRFTIKAFGATRDIFGTRELTIEVEGEPTVSQLRAELEAQYPQLKGLKSLFVAVNHEYAEDQKKLLASDEIALIPPVSGG